MSYIIKKPTDARYDSPTDKGNTLHTSVPLAPPRGPPSYPRCSVGSKHISYGAYGLVFCCQCGRLDRLGETKGLTEWMKAKQSASVMKSLLAVGMGFG